MYMHISTLPGQGGGGQRGGMDRYGLRGEWTSRETRWRRNATFSSAGMQIYSGTVGLNHGPATQNATRFRKCTGLI